MAGGGEGGVIKFVSGGGVGGQKSFNSLFIKEMPQLLWSLADPDPRPPLLL